MNDTSASIVSPLTFQAPTLADVPAMAALYDAEIPHGHFNQLARAAGATTFLMAQAVQQGHVTMAPLEGMPQQVASVWAEVAERAGRIVGFSMNKDWLWPNQFRHVPGRPRDIELWFLAVAPAERRRGTGSALLGRQLASALQMGGVKGLIFARCFRPSTGAKRLLLKEGFVVELPSESAKVLRYKRQGG